MSALLRVEAGQCHDIGGIHEEAVDDYRGM